MGLGVVAQQTICSCYQAYCAKLAAEVPCTAREHMALPICSEAFRSGPEESCGKGIRQESHNTNPMDMAGSGYEVQIDCAHFAHYPAVLAVVVRGYSVCDVAKHLCRMESQC